MTSSFAGEKPFDVAVIGAGFGGMSSALTLAKKGARVALFERLSYPGGCASTFRRQGYRFESGATLFSGFGPGQLFRQWIEGHGLDVQFQPLDPVVEMRADNLQLSIPRTRSEFIERIAAVPGVPTAKVRQFFAWQKKVADALWELFDDPDLLPPFDVKNLFRHFKRSPRYLILAPLVGRSVGDVLRKRGLWEVAPLRTYLNALCQITVQTSADEAEAPFALAAMDYFFRGTGHIHGGIGNFAHALVGAIEELGGQVYLADAVWKLRRHDDHWRIESRRRTIAATDVVANLLPHNLADILGGPPSDWPPLAGLAENVTQGWGAAMLYLGVDAERITNAKAHHLELIDDSSSPFIEGNHIFCSVGAADEIQRAPRGQRVVTVSTHIDINRLWKGDDPDQAEYVEAVQQRMRNTLHRRAPEVGEAIVFEMTASPRTFEQFTNRHLGYVGGIPRRRGLHNYSQLAPIEVADGLYLVGDTVFPGQSTLAVALGGLRVAEAIV